MKITYGTSVLEATKNDDQGQRQSEKTSIKQRQTIFTFHLSFARRLNIWEQQITVELCDYNDDHFAASCRFSSVDISFSCRPEARFSMRTLYSLDIRIRNHPISGQQEYLSSKNHLNKYRKLLQRYKTEWDRMRCISFISGEAGTLKSLKRIEIGLKIVRK